MTKVGYARVSTRDQHLEAQQQRLEDDGCERIFADKASGTLASRPQWDECLRYMREGDMLVTVKLDRIGRSLKNLAAVMATLQDRKISLKVIDQGIDTTTSAGRFTYNLFAAVAEFERDLISERTMDGLAVARARGRIGGAQPKLTPAQKIKAQAMYDELGTDDKRRWTVAEIAGALGVSRPTIYRVLDPSKTRNAG